MTNEKARPETIQRVTGGFYPALAFLGALDLDLFSELEEGAASADAIAARRGWSADKLDRLLHALAAAGLVRPEGGGRFANTPEGRRYLVRASPDYIGDARLIFRDAWQACFETAASVRGGAAQAKHDFAAMDEAALAAFLRGLGPGAAASARGLLRQVNWEGVARLADVGGGSGALAAVLCAHLPGLEACVVELPGVVPVSRALLAERDGTGRVAVVGADLLAAPMAGEYDAAVMRNFLQVFGREEAARALANVARGVVPGGALHILGIGIVDDDRRAPIEAVLFDLVFLNVYDGGRCYTETDYRGFAAAAGLDFLERRTLEGGYGLITLRKPA